MCSGSSAQWTCRTASGRSSRSNPALADADMIGCTSDHIRSQSTPDHGLTPPVAEVVLVDLVGVGQGFQLAAGQELQRVHEVVDVEDPAYHRPARRGRLNGQVDRAGLARVDYQQVVGRGGGER